MLKATARAVASRVGADLGLRIRVQPEHHEDDEADAQRRSRGPEHVPDVLPHAQPTADELGDEDGRLGKRRHLVAEVGAADDRTGGDGLVEAHHPRHRDEGDTEGAGGGPGAAGHHAHEGTHDRGGQVEPGRAHQPDPVVHDRRDGPGHVPGPDQRTDRQQDEDGADRGRDAPDRGVRDAGDRVAVLERHQARERGAQQECHLERPVGGVDPEQGDGERQERDQHDDRQQRVQQRRRSRNPARAACRRSRPATCLEGSTSGLPQRPSPCETA